MPDEPSPAEGVEIPYTTLSPEALQGVMEEFVTRAGTDYGAHEKTLPDKIADVRRQLERGEAIIVFDSASGTIDIVARR